MSTLLNIITTFVLSSQKPFLFSVSILSRYRRLALSLEYVYIYCFNAQVALLSIIYPMALEFSSSLADIKERAELKELQVRKLFISVTFTEGLINITLHS